MKRFHVHVAVADLESSIRFYSSLFGAQPAVTKDDYAKWMLDDPRVNFAISKRGDTLGVNHLGIQVESDEELLEMRGRLSEADRPVVEQANAACCYAESNKHWVQDPQGIAWETFHTLSHIPVFGEDARSGLSRIPVKVAACCVPKLDA
jgi:catechol 2,3-dioxygenase-like lactoylglutathione lyase family enzyme